MFKQIPAIIKRELHFMWRDKGLRMILLLGPLLGLIIFAGVYSRQRIDQIPTAVVDLDKSSASQEVITELKNSQDLHIVTYPDSFDQLEALIQSGKVVVGVVIPEDYGKNLALQRQTRIAVMIDGSNMIYATNASSAVLTVTRTAGAQAGIKSLIARGIQPNQAQEAYQSIDFRQEAWFNPTLNYAYFVVLAFALNIWQQCCTLASCMNIISESGVSSWLQIRSSGISLGQLFVSKSIVHITVFMVMVLPLYFLTFVVLKFPLAGGWMPLLLFTLIFAVTLHSLGTLMSSFSRNAVNASRFGMIIALPSFVISGFTWPLEAMPQWLQHVAWVLPQTWFFQGLNYLTFKNPGWEFMNRYISVLALMAVFFYSLAALITHRAQAVWAKR